MIHANAYNAPIAELSLRERREQYPGSWGTVDLLIFGFRVVTETTRRLTNSAT